MLKAEGNLSYLGVEQFRHALNLAEEDVQCSEEGNTRCPCLIVDLSHVHEVDFTALRVIDLPIQLNLELKRSVGTRWNRC